MSAKKVVSIPDIGEVTLAKRRGNTNIRLSYTRTGHIRVSLPYFVPYEAGISFVKSKKDWLQKHRPAPSVLLAHGDRIGKAHRLRFNPKQETSSVSVRVKDNQVIVLCPADMPHTHTKVQQAVKRGAHRALKKEADQLLPQRLQTLAQTHSFSFRSVETKRLSSRWGSCSQHREIVLNTYLMQLPWHLIDYVIIHELVHTEHLNHSVDFWQRFEEVLPNAKALRKELKKHPTDIRPCD